MTNTSPVNFHRASARFAKGGRGALHQRTADHVQDPNCGRPQLRPLDDSVRLFPHFIRTSPADCESASDSVHAYSKRQPPSGDAKAANALAVLK